ncbi:MAG: hypothetical protein JWO32_1366 [Bacteroidetes bacterium]|nr:hypothetical protein [Bacteroidota bacterium]
MCGITGFVDFNCASSENILENMAGVLSHRGPDGVGYQTFQKNNFQVGLGHRRLSIIDLTAGGKQPMQFKHLWIAFNGEIYNYQEIKTELISLNHNFISKSDTEVILQAYSQWGISCVDKFIGMFSLVIYDTLKEELICIRDRAGVKPFFYYWKEGLFLFASELKSFHQHPHFKKSLNHNALAEFMQMGNVPGNHCIFNHCNKLLPAHYLKFDLKSVEFSLTKYWDVNTSYNTPKLNLSFEEAKEKTEQLLSSAAEYRMISDVPVGIFLSGGFDSTCLTALLQKNRDKKLNTFTIGVKDKQLDESKYARIISSHLGTDHHEYFCTDKEALEVIPQLPFFYDEPFGDHSAIPTMLISKAAKHEVSVALSADGGDELFAGYARYDYIMKHGHALNKVPAFLRKTTYNTLRHFSSNNSSSRYKKIIELIKDSSPSNMTWLLSREYFDNEIERLFIQKVKATPPLFLDHSLKEEHATPLSFIMSLDYKTYLPDDILQKVDRASMSVGLEAREPFIDHRLIEWCAQLPDSFKYNKGIKKHILKEIVYRYVPQKLMDRPKMGFAIPLTDWLYGNLQGLVLFHLSKEKIQNQGLFNPVFIEKITTEFYSGKKEHAQKIWYLLMFQLWHEKWMK